MTDQVIRDPGLQAERTSLAWTRTGLAVAANALLTLRTGMASHWPWLILLGSALLASSAFIVLYGRRREQQLAVRRIEPIPAAVVLCLLIAACLTCAGSLALFILMAN